MSDETLYTRFIDINLEIPDSNTVDIRVLGDSDTDGFIYDTIARAFMKSCPKVQDATGRHVDKYEIVAHGPDIILSRLGITEDERNSNIALGKYATLKPTASFELTNRVPGSAAREMGADSRKKIVYEDTGRYEEMDGVEYRVYVKPFDQQITFILAADNITELWDFIHWFEVFMDLNRSSFRAKGINEIRFTQRSSYSYRGIPLAKAAKLVYSIRTTRWLLIRKQYLTQIDLYTAICNAIGITATQVLS